MMSVARVGLEESTGLMGAIAAPNSNSISLSMLIDFIVQRVYHELTVLSELLPRKNDMERKIEIVQFASRTRQLCVRLLALVKWAGSVSKVDKSATIMAFLDKQSLLFIDTADKLSLIARQELTAARLPMFHIPAAVEVLSTGGYSRLPLCIRDRIVPTRPITAQERISTLRKLNQIIEHRLVASAVPPQMLQLRIAGGRVCMTVRDEFSVTLTLLGDAPTLSWTLLDIEILVQDPSSGLGRSLVHPLQVRYLQQLAESQLRATDSLRPLFDVYQLLHAFCQGLQLQVLHTQLVELCRQRLGLHVRLEQYRPGLMLTLSYWRQQTSARGKNVLSPPTYTIQLQSASNDSDKSSLIVSHTPPLPSVDVPGGGVAGSAVHCGRLSIEKLIVCTVQQRSCALLADLRSRLALELSCSIDQLPLCVEPASLSIPLLLPCADAERLVIGVHVHRGTFTCRLPVLLEASCTICEELASSLDSNDSALSRSLLGRLRFRLVVRRAEKTLQSMHASIHETMPLCLPDSHRLALPDRSRLYARLHRHPNCVLAIELSESSERPTKFNYAFLVLIVRPCSFKGSQSSEVGGTRATNSVEPQLPKKYLEVLTCVELDSFICTPRRRVIDAETDVQMSADDDYASRKRSRAEALLPLSAIEMKRVCVWHHGIPELTRAVALCDEQIPLAALCQELSARGVSHSGPVCQTHSQLRSVNLLRLPDPPSVDPSIVERMREEMLSAEVSLLEDKQGSRWTLHYVFYGCCLVENGEKRRIVTFIYPQPSDSRQMTPVVDRILVDWQRMTALYGLLVDYNRWCERQRAAEGADWTAPASVAAFNHRSITLVYGPRRGACVRVDFCTDSCRFRLTFGVGRCSTGATNPHSIMTSQLESVLNTDFCLAQLSVALDETYSPLVSLDKLPVTPRLGVRGDRPAEPVCNFLVVPQSAWHVRVFYRRVHCLSLHFHNDGMVSVRDGAFSGLEKGRHLEELAPIPNLAAFLVRYQSDPVGFCGLGAECEGLPSPTSLDLDPPSHLSTAGLIKQTGSHVGSPVTSARDGRFAHPMTPGSSNPHTPASPLQPSPAAPPPPSQLAAHSPGNSLHAPSPGGFLQPQPSPVGHSPAAAVMSPFASQQVIGGKSSQNVIPPAAVSVTASQQVLVSHETLDILCTRARLPTSVMVTTPEALLVSPLERFLGCVYTRNHLRKTLDEEAASNIVRMACPEQGVTVFRTVCLQCRVRLEPQRVQTLHLNVQPCPEAMDQQWSAEQLQTLERFFDTKVAVPPYRQNTLKTFVRILNMQPSVLRDFIRIMQLEELTTSPGNMAGVTNWTVEWCTTSPPAVPALIPTGVVSLMNAGNKLLFFLQLTRRLPPTAGVEPNRLVLPIVYNMPENSTQCADRKDTAPNQVTTLVNHMMRRSSDAAIQANECSIFPAVRDVVHGLILPSEQQVLQAGDHGAPSANPAFNQPGVRPPNMAQQGGWPVGPQMGMSANFPSQSG